MTPRFHSLDPAEIVRTLERLEARIRARFPEADLADVTREVRDLVAATAARIEAIGRPDWRLRVLAGSLIAAGAAGLVAVATQVDFGPESANLFSLVQSIEALVNLTILSGAAILSLITIERRVRRDRALDALDPFRAIVHVIDMHQLTKDPGMIGPGAIKTTASPERSFSPFELSRYLDYCSELLSLTAKGAALYALATADAAINTSVNEIEQLTTNLSQKIWQKIMIIDAGARADAERPSAPGD